MTIDTSKYDQFRQGIYKYKPNIQKGIVPTIGPEITGSVIIQNSFGQAKNHFDNTTLVDLDRYSSVAYITDLSGSVGNSLLDLSSPEQFDGVIEPFLIRESVAFSSIESPYIARSIKGECCNGNRNYRGGYDYVVDKFLYTLPEVVVPFIDASDHIGSLPETSVRLPGVFSEAESILAPFIEESLEQIKKVSVFEKSATGDDMIIALESMNPGTDSLMGNDAQSSRTGFTYTNSPQGIDSIAFGGLLRG